MFLRLRQDQILFSILTLALLSGFILGFALHCLAQNTPRVITFTDDMGVDYTFSENPNRTQISWLIERPYSQYPEEAGESGTFYNVNMDNFIALQGEMRAYVAYVNDLGHLQVHMLGGTYWWAKYRNRAIQLDINLDSLLENQVQIFRMHRYGMEISWVDSNGKTKYAILTIWEGVVEEGDLEDYPGGSPVIVDEDFGALDPGRVQGPISGKSVALVLDSSGSMDGDKIKKAKKQIVDRVRKLSPDDEVALLIFEGCGDVPLIQPYTQDESLIIQGLDQATAEGGSSPVAESIRKGMYYLVQYHHGQKGELTIYTDGGENCEGDPVAAARDVKAATFPIDFSVVGYNVSKEDQKELKEIAKAADGEFDKEKVWESQDQKKEAKDAQKKVAAFGLTALLTAFTAYVTQGSFNLGNMFNNVFGAKGLFAGIFKTGSSGASTGVGSSSAGAASAAPQVPPTPPPAKIPPKSLKSSKKGKAPKPKKQKPAQKKTTGKQTFCTQCGSPRSSSAQFCTNCGNKFD